MPSPFNYPLPEDVRDNEMAALKFLSENREIRTYYKELAEDAQTGYSRLRTIKKIMPRMRLLDFESYMKIKVNEKLRRVFIGGLIELADKSTYKSISYSMAISQEIRPSKVIRRFHFDYDAGNDVQSRSAKPFYHLQYGGNISPRMRQEGFADTHNEHSDPDFSEPRISYFPMSIIFLVYLALKEFDKEHLDILSKPEWHVQLCNSEKLMLRPFYSECCRAYGSQKSVLMDYYYP